uniref:Uncharacterized protein n=1 Tax=Magallana gigas TaxID=29159 RepID=K1R2G5_MAGGI
MTDSWTEMRVEGRKKKCSSQTYWKMKRKKFQSLEMMESTAAGKTDQDRPLPTGAKGGRPRTMPPKSNYRQVVFTPYPTVPGAGFIPLSG